MKIDRSRVRKSTSDVPIECQQLIERLQGCSRTELLEELSKIKSWTFGKCELLHWALVLDVFDKILGEACKKDLDNPWSLHCDTGYTAEEKRLLLWILHFTTLLIEHSFSRHLYNSLEHLLVLLESNEMSIVLGVLNLLYMFSKRSNFISRLSTDKKNSLLPRLHYLAENWGGKENGFGLADCCIENRPIPSSATTLHVEFHRDNDDKDTSANAGKKGSNIIHIENVNKINQTPAEMMKSLVDMYYVPVDKQMWLFTHVRLAHHFAEYSDRLLCVQARLQALSVLVYSNAIHSSQNLLYNGFLEELVELVELEDIHLGEIRSGALRALTAIIHLDRNPHIIQKKPGSRLNNIIDVTGASQYHGFLPLLVRNFIITLTNKNANVQVHTGRLFPSRQKDLLGDVLMQSCEKANVVYFDNKFSLTLATALFSFLYHLASYESGCEALVSCGMMESLLQVINWHGTELEHITFVTRAVRVIDLITNMDMQAFQTHGGLQKFINRLNVEVTLCAHEQFYEVKTINSEQNLDESVSTVVPSASLSVASDESEETSGGTSGGDSGGDDPPEVNSVVDFVLHGENVGKTCLPQRAALLKSMLNFLKKALQDSAFSDSIRHLMEGTLPTSLKNIIANAEYYGPSLFLLATDVVTVYVYQEPALLPTLQDNGLTDVVLYSLLVKDIPPTREVLGSLPNVFTALCLNMRGLMTFTKYKPFEKTFSVLLSPEYLPALRRRRSSEPLADTAINLGNAMDELMRHQPTLKSIAIKAIINLLKKLIVLGTDPRYICWKPHSKSEASSSPSPRTATNAEGSSDEEDEDEEEASTSSQNGQNYASQSAGTNTSERTPIPLVDFILNVMKFIDAILSNNSTDDHCREFTAQNGLKLLLNILGLPNLPVNCPITNPAQAVATVSKSILNLTHETDLFKEALHQLGEVLDTLKPMYKKLDVPSGPKLLMEFAGAANVENAFNNAAVTPLLHAMGAAHGYVIMLVHVCRTGQSEIRNLSLQCWGSEEGLRVIKCLAELYTSLVWESTLLLAYCSEEHMPSDFTREDIEKLNAFFDKCESNGAAATATGGTGGSGTNSGDTAVNVASAMEALSTNPGSTSMEVDREGVALNLTTSLKYIKPLLGASSRLGRALAELFGLLVKLCVGSPIRQRRGQNIIAAPPLPTPWARSVATALNVLLADGLDHERLPACPFMKSRITFLICSVGFTSPMLFDEKRYPYHLMLKKFVALGGQTTFFNTFKWALTSGGTMTIDEALKQPKLPDGIAGFLDAWLMLLEKMVNPKAILESPHIVSNRTVQGSTYRGYMFDPLKYLIQIHKLAFESIMLLWDKAPLATYGTRLSENILTILRHILRGEKIIKEKMKSEESTDLSRPKAAAAAAQLITSRGTGNAPPSTNPSIASGSEGENDANVVVPPAPVISSSDGATAAGNQTSSNRMEPNQDVMNQLIDMGFSREHVMVALINTLTVEQATDYLLSNPPPSYYRTSQTLFEEDQMTQAIEISLGDASNSGRTSSSTSSTSSNNSDSKNASKSSKTSTVPDDGKPLAENLIDDFTNKALEACLKLLEASPESVHKICELLVTIIKRNGREFRDNLLIKMVQKMYECALYVRRFIAYGRGNVIDQTEEEKRAATRLGIYLHLYILFFEVSIYFEMKIPCALAAQMYCFSAQLLQLINTIDKSMATPQFVTPPPWLSPALLLVDSVAKVSFCTYRKRQMHLSTVRVWRWFQLETGKWTPYSNSNNKIINDAYWNGEQSVRVTCSRRRYTINFNTMLQLNDESGNNRPISMTLVNTFLPSVTNYTMVSNNYKMKPVSAQLSEREEKRSVLVPPFEKKQEIDLINTCVRLLKQPLEKDLLHAVLQCSVRLTRDYGLAKLFVQNGGVKCLLKLQHIPDFSGFPILTTILIRHTLEEPTTVAYAIEKIIRVRSSLNTPPQYRELLYMSRLISGAVTRSPDSFIDVAKCVLRLDNSNAVGTYRDFDGGVPIKTDSPTRLRLPIMEGIISADVIGDLLNALLNPLEMFDEDDEDSDNVSDKNTSESNTSETPINITTNQNQNSTGGNGNEQTKKKKNMIGKSVILKILTEAVISYGPVAKLIADFTYRAGRSPLVPEDCSALSFLLDKILPETDNISDGESSTMCRMLLASMASANHAPDAQYTLVNEVRAALIRAVAMVESNEKHTQIQLVAGVIYIIIDSCSALQARSKTLHQMHNIVKLMIRKSIFNDLARVPHYLDLSSPNTPFTVNACLKSLEALARIVNQPVPVNSTKSGNIKKSTQHVDDDIRSTLFTAQEASINTPNLASSSSSTVVGTSTLVNDTPAPVVSDDTLVTETNEQIPTSATEVADVIGCSEEPGTSSVAGTAISDGQNSESTIEDSVVMIESGNHAEEFESNTAVMSSTPTENSNILFELNMLDQLFDQGGENNQNLNDQATQNHNMDVAYDGNLTYDIGDPTDEMMSTDSGESDSNPSDQVEDEENEDLEGEEENANGNYEDEELVDRQSRGEESEVMSRMVTYPLGNTHVPFLDEINNANDAAGPVIHPLLMSRGTSEPGSAVQNARAHRANRTRRYQYLFNPRNPNPSTVILQRLLGPHEPQVNLANGIMGADIREPARLVILDDITLWPPHEEQIDFVDQASTFFSSNPLVNPILHWWNIESKCLDIESVHDCVVNVCNELVPILVDIRNAEYVEKNPHLLAPGLSVFKKIENSLEEMEQEQPIDTTLTEANQSNSEDDSVVYLDQAIDFHMGGSSDDGNNDTLVGGTDEGAAGELNTDSALSVASPGDRSTSTNPQILNPSLLMTETQRLIANITAHRRGATSSNRNASTSAGSATDNNTQQNRLFCSLLMGEDILFSSRDNDTDEQQSSSDGLNETERQLPPVRESQDEGRLSNFDVTMNEETPSSGGNSSSSNNSHTSGMPNSMLFIRGENFPQVISSIDLSTIPVVPEPPAEDEHDVTEENLPNVVLQVGPDLISESTTTISTRSAEGTSSRATVQSEQTEQSEQSVATNQNEIVGESSSSGTNTGASSSSEGINLDDIPEGVDRSFLEALPQEMRQEVLEQYRVLRLQQRMAARSEENNDAEAPAEVSPEFLAALPPSLQEEVLSYQRIEQQRQAASQADPDEPVDAGAFFETLQPSLRTIILSDMEDSQMSALPPDLAAEAQTLRRDWETRNRQLVQERIWQTNLSSLIRHSTRNRQTLHHHSSTAAMHHRAQWTAWNSRDYKLPTAAPLKIRGRQLLDHEGLACLLVLLFTDDGHLAKLRLHGVVRNLCYHAPTRDWLINALLSIIHRSVNIKQDETSAIMGAASASNADGSSGGCKKKTVKPGPLSSKLLTNPKLLVQNSGNWLNIRMEAALGCSANVFIINRTHTGKRSSTPSTISIHPQAAPIVCRNALDLLTSLAKSFPSCLLPIKSIRDTIDDESTAGSNNGRPTLTPVRVRTDGFNDFWDVLLKLDSVSTKKGKSIPRSSNSNAGLLSTQEGSSGSNPDSKLPCFENSVFGQLLSMLATPIVSRNTHLTDMLLRLLSVITTGIPDLAKQPQPMTLVTTSSISTTSSVSSAFAPSATIKFKPGKHGKFDNMMPTQALTLAVNVIIMKNCSEEGLEFITNLLLNLANSSVEMCYTILNLLLTGAVHLGEMVTSQIQNMLTDLEKLNLNQAKKTVTPTTSGGSGEDGASSSTSSGGGGGSSSSSSSSMPSTSKGTISNRFTKETVVITAASKVKTTGELQLPSMMPLTSKSSSQIFFLRILRVIVQIRNSFKQSMKMADSPIAEIPALSDQLCSINNLWDTLSMCLLELEHAPDHHAVLVLQPAVEAFFLVHSPQQVATKAKEPEEETTENRTLTNTEQETNTATGSDNNDPQQQQQQQGSDSGENVIVANSPFLFGRFVSIASYPPSTPPPSSQSSNTDLAAPSTSHPAQNLGEFDSDATAASGAHLGSPSPTPSSSQSSSNASTNVIAGDAKTSTGSSASSSNLSQIPAEQQKFLSFAEKHRRVLNQILRQSTTHLADGPFAVLVDHARILDFDIKRRYFRVELERMDQGIRREETAVHVRRSNIFEDSFRELYRRSPEEWKNRFYIVFEDEEGQDAGGLLREWYVIISRDIFNPMYALFTVSPGDRVTYMINSASHYNPNHLCYYKFVGRVIAKAIYDNKLLECYFTRSFYKHILGIPVKYTDMESEDYTFYRGLVYLMENNINNLGLDLTFSTEINEFGVTETRDLIPNGRHVPVTEETKMEYIRRSCQLKMTGAIKKQLNAFLEGFYDIIPMRLISIFNEQELELLISGLPNVDIEDLKSNTEYHKYQPNSLQIQWFWRALRSFDQADRAKFLQFVTGTSKVPLQGFGALEGMNGVQKFQIHRDDRSTDRLPSAHTCFNQLDLPVYETYDKLRSYLSKAIHECSEGFGFA